MVLERSGKLLAEDVPPAPKAEARKKVRRTVIRSLFSNAIPVLIAFATLFYLCLPMTLNISRSSNLQFWNFDLLKTLFVFLELAIAACLILSTIVAVRLLWRIWLTLRG
jgi:hypothetical protein